ncbi:MAG: hypothetical protein D3M94_16350 [Rhodocyclales bacterium GT-UBC]|nr:MAG: hypothetical protein D3M94_16350 [Rhodocyclales bacterium GT-UBC]
MGKPKNKNPRQTARGLDSSQPGFALRDHRAARCLRSQRIVSLVLAVAGIAFSLQKVGVEKLTEAAVSAPAKTMSMALKLAKRLGTDLLYFRQKPLSTLTNSTLGH